ncbi:MAG: phosphate ABC transporter permease family protein, partial [Halieaceae bacterium]|nr:phosphate ABC transporter permease family protein [Halieaceae bacterium]
MDTPTVFLLLIVLSIAGFFLGRRRSRTVVAGEGGARALHSLPKHYGYMAALWALLPALGLLLLWMLFETSILANIVIGELPASVQQLP